MKTFNCRNCNKEHPRSRHTTNTYCSNVCQREWQSKERVRQWLEEGLDWKIQVPQWAKRYIEEQRGYACECCGISEWNGKQLILECDHKDGNPHNNFYDNLRLICPNCHSQTESFKGKNYGNGRKGRYS